MNPKLLVIVLVALLVILAEGWVGSARVHPPGILVPEAPTQQPAGHSVFGFNDHVLTRRAKISLRARVLSTERYWLDRGSRLSPVDLALGWGAMSDQAVLERISVTQGGRWYFTRYELPAPVSDQDIILNSSNMHMIPSRPYVEKKLKKLRRGDLVELHGYLVDVDHASGWHWRTSLSRSDTGNGSCEIFYVEEIRVSDRF